MSLPYIDPACALAAAEYLSAVSQEVGNHAVAHDAHSLTDLALIAGYNGAIDALQAARSRDAK